MKNIESYDEYDERLKDIMSVQSVTYISKRMRKYIKRQVTLMMHEQPDHKFDMFADKQNIYITKGDADTYPCVVAHTDTVHDIIKFYEVFHSAGVMFAMNMETVSQTGIGGDDKVGIFVALEMLRKHDNIKIAFFRDEESGCLGSAEAIMDWFSDVEFVLQCDRRGYKDFVRRIMGNELFDDTFSEAIAPYLEEWRKEETLNGGMTDVYQLVENGFKRCVANISCGYYRPHSDEEWIEVQEVYDTMHLVDDIITNLSGQVWDNSEYKQTRTLSRYGSRYDGWGYGDTYDAWDGDRVSNQKSKVKTYDSVRDYENDKYNNEAFWRRAVWCEIREKWVEPEDTIEREHECSVCHTVDIIYDSTSNMDWCYTCDMYTNVYGDDGNSILDEDKVEEDGVDYITKELSNKGWKKNSKGVWVQSGDFGEVEEYIDPNVPF